MTSAELATDAGPARIGDLVALLRPTHCVKSVVVVSLALLRPASWRPGVVGRLSWAVDVFVVASALVYVVNDVVDRRRDRAHPVKRRRPVASGRVSVPAAMVVAGSMAIALAALLATAPVDRSWPVLAYLALNAAYTWRLKHVPFVDALVIAAGFVLRVAGGCVALGVSTGGWLPVSVFCCCLLLTLGKRRAELGVPGSAHRPALRGYPLRLLTWLMPLMATLSAVSYFRYVAGELGGAAALVTAPCAGYALFRYLRRAIATGADPVGWLLGDVPMLVNGAVWAGLLGTALVAGGVV